MYKTLSRLMAAAVLTVGAGLAHADTFPDRPIRLIVPQSAGSGGDVLARLMAQSMGKTLGASIVVENRAGANGIIGISSLSGMPPDGYAIALAGVSQVSFNKHVYPSVPYETDDFTYIAPVADTPYVLVVSKASGIKTLAQFIERARAKPKAMTFGSAGVGNMTHLTMEMLAAKTGISLTHVPYKGSAPAMTGVMSGEVDAMVSVVNTALSQIKNGDVIALAVLGNKRIAALPDVPTSAEQQIDLPPMPGWYALIGPKGIPDNIVSRLDEGVKAFVNDPATQQRMDELFLVPMKTSGAQIQARAMAESVEWGKFIRDNNLQSQ
ncbi:tripartite tricarboxylate transporter substrate binding protein [Alcaligenaceae bacterium A4P071]|nr:tripartite tricarboxylate transporter substrate binding protein [Alcaligenaceae bacterium B3P038]MDQ2185281.1 tripartite tricarboxylate transporter substrate binding protein [Alcaligenaceae bacterium A4P071]